MPPRHCYPDRLEPEERMIHDAMVEVENLGAHGLLTAVSLLLLEARNALCDWTDQGRPGANIPRR